MKKLLLYFFIVMSGAMTAKTIKNRDAGPTDVALTITDATCGLSNGYITFGTVTGGVAPFQFSIDNGVTFSTTTTYYGLVPNTYSLAVKDSNGDVFNTTATIVDHPGPTAITTTIVNEVCGASNGSITINSVTGGTAPYQYSFNGNGFTGATTNFTGLPAGIYQIIVMDMNGCQYSTSVFVDNIPGPTAIATTVVNPSSCNGNDGSVTLGTVTGGTAPHTYSFDGSPFTPQTIYTGLYAGSHTIYVKDANGCSYFSPAYINAPTTITAVATTVVNTSSCGGSDGSVTIDNVTGGVAPYMYSLDSIPYQSSNMFYTLSPGSYSLNVKDVNGCEYSTTVTVFPTDDRSVIINYPNSPYSTTLTSPQPVTISGTGAYTGGAFSVAPPGLVINTTTGSITTFNSVPGTYTVTYTLFGNTICPTISVTTTVTIVDTFNLTMTGIYNDYNADGFVNIGDVINYQFTVANYDSLPVTDISISNYNMTSTGFLASLVGGASDSTTFTAVHVINQTDINNGYVTVDAVATGTYNSGLITSVTTTTTPLSISDGILLNAFIDTNGNGIKDGSELNYNDGEFHFELNDDGTIHNVSSSLGMYTIYETNAIHSYDVSFTTNNTNYSVSTSSYNNITVANGSGITTYNFPVTAVPYTDLRVSIYQSGVPPRPGFTYQNQILVKNTGNQTVPAGTLTFTNDNRVTITNVSPSATMNATGFTYNYSSLSPNQTRYFSVTMQVPTIPTIALGDLLTNTVSVAIPAGDANTTNNSASLTQTIVGSYDPNDKNESHGPEIVHSTFTSNDYLNYTIQFENTGTANAVIVKVDDVLDAKLDETSIKMIDASHNYVLDRVGNNLTWTFSGIELPPSVPDTTIGKGYINFQVKPKAGYAIGDIINNTAYIYFDFNPAIVTNTFATEFVATLGVAGFVNSQFSAYPNPTTGIITIALKNSTGSIDTVIVTDVLGKTVMTNSVHSANTTVDLSSLTKGLYFVKIQAEGQVKTLKVVKE